MGKPRKVCAIVALLGCATTVKAAPPVDPIVITLDGRHYVTYTAPLVISPAERLAQAPEARMTNCRRSSGQLLAAGAFRLIYSAEGAFVEAIDMQLAFNPPRIVFATQTGDVICDGEAQGFETGIDRLFRDQFE